MSKRLKLAPWLPFPYSLPAGGSECAPNKDGCQLPLILMQLKPCKTVLIGLARTLLAHRDCEGQRRHCKKSRASLKGEQEAAVRVSGERGQRMGGQELKGNGGM